MLWEREPTVHVVRSAGSVGSESEDRRKTSRDLRCRPLVGQHRDPHPAAVGRKKGGQSERLPNSERAAKGAMLPHSLPLRRKDRCAKLPGCTLPGRRGNIQELRALRPPAGLAAPRPPTVLRLIHGLPPRRHRPAKRPPSPTPPPTAASPCVLRKLALAVETGSAAGEQERPLSSRQGEGTGTTPLVKPCHPPKG